MKIALSCNIIKFDGAGNVLEKYREYDSLETINAIKEAIEKLGHDVIVIEADEFFTEKLLKVKPDFVFNIAEGIQGVSREAYVPTILEQLGIPFSGSGSFTQLITLNKKRCGEFLDLNKIPVPKSVLLTEVKNFNLKFPVIVKPNFEGSSKGINKNSVIYDENSLKKQIKMIVEEFNQPAIVEEYLPGREFSVGLIGNPLKVLPIIEINFNHLPEGIPPIDGYEAKWLYDSVEACICPAKIDYSLKTEMEEIAIKAFNALDCADLCRLDIRLDNDGKPRIIDVNSLPGLIPDPKENSRFPRMCFTLGMKYEEIIKEILLTAFKRNKILSI